MTEIPATGANKNVPLKQGYFLFINYLVRIMLFNSDSTTDLI